MATILAPGDYIHLLRCPCSARSSLALEEGRATCSECGKAFNISADAVLELVDLDTLDTATARELQGNIYQFSQRQIELVMAAEREDVWKSYYTRKRRRSIERLSGYLDKIGCDRIIALGVGTAREIEYLLRFRTFDSVFCSDLSYTTLCMVPYRLEPCDLKLGLFTSDLCHCPVRIKDIPLLVVGALHHTPDMHAAIEGLLANGYHNILFVEPADNFLLRGLARLGLARREEYSGVKPGRLELGRLRTLSRQYGYSLAVATAWVFPDDYYARIFGRVRGFQRLFCLAVDLLSTLTNLAKFGNSAIVHLQKT
ncbi:MAG: hypothetical protein JW850_11015 [Thermoflexales bacterium]|nr:hypothetical protein [Thermoflexales bacterium]